MYNQGDYVICKNGGIWRVLKVGENRLDLLKYGTDIKKELNIDDNQLIKKIITEDSMKEIIKRIPYIVTINATNDKDREYLYNYSMNFFDEIEWLKIIKTIYLRKKSGKVREFELEYEKKAKDFLHSEISILLNINVNDVESYIIESVKNDDW